jgi:homocysteine S-methyltransferase
LPPVRIGEALAEHSIILAEGSVYELLRRDPAMVFDPLIAHAGLIYDAPSRARLAEVHRGYLSIAEAHAFPCILLADTWRASLSRVAASQFRGRCINSDNVAFLRALAAGARVPVLIAALLGPAGDAYRPAEAPGYEQALSHHAGQIEELARSGADLIIAATLPAFDEARAIAALLRSSGTPWMVSFVIRPDGTLLDGTSLVEAIAGIDGDGDPPLGYSINCVHSATVLEALRGLPADTRRRLLMFQANTSRLRPDELDGRADLDTEDPEAFAAGVVAVASRSSIRIVGGCCGSGRDHIEALARALAG